jgi:hypothetical protein
MGESACWLDQVCWACGRVSTDLDEDGHCGRCDRRTSEADGDAPATPGRPGNDADRG